MGVSVQATNRFLANNAVKLYDFDPNGVDPVDVDWVPFHSFLGLVVGFFRTIGVGAVDGLKILANTKADGSGTDVVVKAHALGSQPDAVGDQVWLEVTAEEVRQACNDAGLVPAAVSAPRSSSRRPPTRASWSTSATPRASRRTASRPTSSPDLMLPRKVIAGPAKEPLTLEEAKRFLRITTNAEDDDVLAIVAAARKRIERGTELALITQTVEVKLDGFWGAYALELPMPPLQSVEAITYVDRTAPSRCSTLRPTRSARTGVRGACGSPRGRAGPRPRTSARSSRSPSRRASATSPRTSSRRPRTCSTPCACSARTTTATGRPCSRARPPSSCPRASRRCWPASASRRRREHEPVTSRARRAWGRIPAGDDGDGRRRGDSRTGPYAPAPFFPVSRPCTWATCATS